MSKVVLTQEQAKVLEKVKSSGDCSRDDIIRIHVTTGWFKERVAMNEINLDTLVKAVYIGYEVEQTPEELLAKMYKEKLSPGFVSEVTKHFENIQQSYYSGWHEGIRVALKTLGIKIIGINIPGINGDANE